MKLSILAAVLGPAITTVTAQTAKHCPAPDGDVCYAVNIPDKTASSGSGDIYFQIQGPSSKQWIGLGQGAQMAGANIFIVYADASGANVTLSPRLGKGNFQPSFNKDAQVFLLEGSGIADGKLTANVRCSSCTSWAGGKMDFSSSSSSWIWSFKNGSPVKDSSQSASLQQHDNAERFSFDLSAAKGGNSLNPFVQSTSTNGDTDSSAPSGSNASPSSTASADGDNSGSSSGSSEDVNPGLLDRATTAHGTLMGLAFLGFYPLGAILIRYCSFKNLVWVHAGTQALAYTLALAGMGLGVYIGTTPDYRLDDYHPVIGLLIVGLLLLQPPLGYWHHVLYLRTHAPTSWGAVHVWLGRLLITLGIINGGLGLKYAEAEKGSKAAYGVCAALVWLVWIGSVVWYELRKGRRGGGAEGGGGGNGDGEGIAMGARGKHRGLGSKENVDGVRP